MKHEGVGLRPLQDRVRGTGEMISRAGIGEREAIGGIEVVLVVLACRPYDVGEAVVHPHQPATRDMRQDAVEDTPPVARCVETEMHEVAQAASTLRAAPAVSLFDAQLSQRVGFARSVLPLVAQEARDLPHSDMTETKHE